MPPSELIRRALEHIRDNDASNERQTFLDYLRPALSGDPSTSASKNDLQKIFIALQQLEKDVALRMLPSQERNMCEHLLSDVSEILSIPLLRQSAQAAINRSRQNITYMLMTLSIVERIYSEGLRQDINLHEIENVIEKLAAQIAQTNNIADKERSLVTSCLELVRRATSRAKGGYVSSFQDEVLCAVGRLQLSLKDNSRSEQAKDLINSISDGLLRIAGLAELAELGAGLIGYCSPSLLGYDPS